MTRQRGITLIECLAALALISITLLAATALTGSGPLAAARVTADAEAGAAIENIAAAFRSGQLPLVSGRLDASALGAAPARTQLTVVATVEPEPTPGLFRLRLEARYTAAGQARTRALETLIWRRS